MTTIRDYPETAHGQAFQGDVLIARLPVRYADHLDKSEPVPPVAGRLILQEGEVTGHHHAIRLPGMPQVAMFRDDALTRDLAASAPVSIGTAVMHRDRALSDRLVRDGILTRSDLVVGFLTVEGGPMTVTHEEHDGIRLPPGLYLIGRQIESAGAEERMVQD